MTNSKLKEQLDLSSQAPFRNIKSKTQFSGYPGYFFKKYFEFMYTEKRRLLKNVSKSGKNN